MTPEMFFDYLAVHINGEKAGNAKSVFKTISAATAASISWMKTAC